MRKSFPLQYGSLDLAQLLISANQHAAAGPALARSLKSATALAESESARLVPSALYLRAVCEFKLDKISEAAATLDDLLNRFPTSDIAPSAQLLSGQALLKSNKPEAAATRLEAAIASNQNRDSLGPALLCLGEAHAAAQQWEKSRTAFVHHLNEFPKSEHWFQSKFGIAWALEHEGRHAEAISTYREVVAKHNGPTAARAQFQVGECLFAQKQYDEAVRELLKVDILYAYPEWSAAALYEAGRCLAQVNKTAEARTQFTQVTDRFKETQWARLATEQLQKTAPAAPSTLPGRAAGENR
jgi:TolA-binding protein